MARPLSPFATLLRQNPRGTRQVPNTQFRNLCVESKESSYNQNQGPSNNINESFAEVAKQVSKITRTRPRWEKTIIADFPSFNFNDPRFFHELISHQSNVLLLLQFFKWLRSQYNFLPDPDSCSVVFDALVEAKACEAAKWFVDTTQFSPGPGSLERYVCCLSQGGLVPEAVDVLIKLTEVGVSPSIVTWNAAMSGCLKMRRNDLVWQLYSKMMEVGVVADADFQTVAHLIEAFCNDGKVDKAYELLRQALKNGFESGTVAFNMLISRFCMERNYGKVSELLHTMIAKNCAPDIYTYQEVINGLCKKRKQLEAFRIFNDLQDRGYAPDRVMYTTMIHGLCNIGWLGDARKLWFQMISKGLLPNEYTYNTLIHGFCKIGKFAEARELYQEMCDRGYAETTVSYNTMITGLCLHGRINEAGKWFEEMHQKGINPDVITYNALILGFCKEGKITEGEMLFNKLLAQGLQPSTSSYTPLVEKLCEVGDVQEAIRLLRDMLNRGLEPLVCTHDHVITGLCEQGYAAEGMEWLIEMLEQRLKPRKRTFERMVQCLSQSDRLDDSFLVLDLMFKIGYALNKDICHSLLTEFCKENSHFVENCLEEILQRN